ncbi:hypothetical protein HQ560_11900 [bacterium]|nr:hypothetical protein [bacterium]
MNALGPPVPGVSPTVYEDIHGAVCDHHFARASTAGTRRYFSDVLHWDGFSSEWPRAVPRTEAIEFLYAAFARTGDRDTARGVYDLIDGAYPIQGLDTSELDTAWKLYRRACGDKEVLSAWEEGRELPGDDYRSCVGLDATALTLAEMAWRLKSVETVDDFRQVLDDFKPRLKPALAEE